VRSQRARAAASSPPGAVAAGRGSARRRIEQAALVVFPALFLLFAALFVADRELYVRLTLEDHAIEWLTVAVLLLTAPLAFLAARRTGRGFYVLLGIAALLVAVEEVSWGQRLLGIESPDFFLRHSDQREINVHNVVQRWTGVTMKIMGGVALGLYGIALPLLDRIGRLPRILATGLLVIPPLALVPAFGLATVLIFDLPTHREEELAELLYALAFLTLVLISLTAEDGQRTHHDR
jgi:hypothetical protein